LLSSYLKAEYLPPLIQSAPVRRAISSAHAHRPAHAAVPSCARFPPSASATKVGRVVRVHDRRLARSPAHTRMHTGAAVPLCARFPPSASATRWRRLVRVHDPAGTQPSAHPHAHGRSRAFVRALRSLCIRDPRRASRLPTWRGSTTHSQPPAGAPAPAHTHTHRAAQAPQHRRGVGQEPGKEVRAHASLVSGKTS
jgi:hypothetical protein